jgi:predicted TPR repeat methyltransferase
MADFERARQRFLDGNAAFQSGALAEAEAAFRDSLAALPGRPSTLTNLGATLIQRGQPEAALAPLAQALAAEPGNLDAWCHQGVALAALGRHAQALESFAHAHAIDATHGPADWHAALALQALERHAEVVETLQRLLRHAPDHAPAWLMQGEALQALQRHEEALAAYERALHIDPTLGDAWSQRGGMLRDAGRLQEAAECYRQALAHGADPELNGYFLAALQADAPTPPAAPAHYVQAIFDSYAAQFDQHLVEVLQYTAPQQLAAGVSALARSHFESALDLGCGTGLCGPLLRAQVQRLHGVDLSANMLAQARALGVYEMLVQDDVAAHLHGTDQRHDLVVAADVFIYVGALREVFAGVARVLRPGGLFAFSVEEALGEEGAEGGFALRSSLRYAHREDYLRALAAEHGFVLRGLARHALREDQRRPVPGLFIYLQQP